MAEKKSFLLRLKPETWAELERWAADEFRSVNGQIEYLLHEAIRRQRRRKPAEHEVPAALDRREEEP